MKKLIIIIILFAFIFLFFVVSSIYQNDKYQNDIYGEIVSNYKIDEDIVYFNKSNIFYIVKTESKIIVLDNNFDNVYEIECSKILPQDNYEIVYKDNTIIYEEIKRYENKIVYNYYSVLEDKLLDVIEFEG